VIPRAWKRRKPAPGRCGGGGSRARAGGGRGTESSPPAPPARSRSEIPESGARPKWRQRAAEQAAKSSAGAEAGGGRGLCAPRVRRAAASRLPRAVSTASDPGAAWTSSAPRWVQHGVRRPAAPPGASAVPRWITQSVEPGGGRARAAPSIRGARVRSQRQLSRGFKREEGGDRHRGGGSGRLERRG
jgi:hypothetical protein